MSAASLVLSFLMSAAAVEVPPPATNSTAHAPDTPAGEVDTKTTEKSTCNMKVKPPSRADVLKMPSEEVKKEYLHWETCLAERTQAATSSLVDARNAYAGAALSNALESATHGRDYLEGLVQVLGQVVVDKAVESGWTLLSRRLKELARCDPSMNGRLVHTCKVLGADIHDLIANPDMLVSAAIQDLLDPRKNEPSATMKPFTILQTLSRSILAESWRTGGISGMATQVARDLHRQLVRIFSEHPVCEGSAAEKTAWTLGKCIVDGYDRCDAAEILKTPCSLDAELIPSALAAVAAWNGGKAPSDVVNTAFALELVGASDDREAILRGLQGLMVGLIDRDANRALTAAGDLFIVFADAQTSTKEDKHKADDPPHCGHKDLAAAERSRCARELFTLLVAVAQMPREDGDDAVAARKEAVKGLITRLTRRTGRRSGAVASLGGSFALIGGARMAREPDGPLQATYASPIHLGLGFGLDSYHRHDRAGLHLEVTALDLGQYVALSDGNLTVERPDLKAALAPSVKLGVHFALKETPLYVALFGGVSPFVRSAATMDAMGDGAGDRTTWSAGLVLGIYVPFLDFN